MFVILYGALCSELCAFLGLIALPLELRLSSDFHNFGGPVSTLYVHRDDMHFAIEKEKLAKNKKKNIKQEEKAGNIKNIDKDTTLITYRHCGISCRFINDVKF